MPQSLPLPIQTLYAELVERCALDRLADDFPASGSFFTKTVKGRRYWYFREAVNAEGKRRDRYVGPETPELEARIGEHRRTKADRRERRMLVTALQRAGLRGPDARTGRVLQALADAGVFRLRAVMVGTGAYQTYSALLGVLLPSRNATTSDLDLAQFHSVSVAVEDEVDVPFGAILQRVDPRFRPVPGLGGDHHATRYAIGSEFRVDILVPNRGPDTEEPLALPALQADAQPLRFLDFLIYGEVQAAVLHGDGVLVNVPAPERFALHKLLVSRLRVRDRESQAKATKDLRQAADLLAVLIDQRPYELRDLWAELRDRGPTWRRLAQEAVTQLDHVTGSPDLRERLTALV